MFHSHPVVHGHHKPRRRTYRSDSKIRVEQGRRHMDNAELDVRAGTHRCEAGTSNQHAPAYPQARSFRERVRRGQPHLPQEGCTSGRAGLVLLPRPSLCLSPLCPAPSPTYPHPVKCPTTAVSFSSHCARTAVRVRFKRRIPAIEGALQVCTATGAQRCHLRATTLAWCWVWLGGGCRLLACRVGWAVTATGQRRGQLPTTSSFVRAGGVLREPRWCDGRGCWLRAVYFTFPRPSCRCL